MPEFTPFYQQSELYEIFMHQAILAGSLLTSLKQNEFLQFPREVNYPLHLHSRMSTELRHTELGQLITCRYEEIADTLQDPLVKNLLATDKPVMDWLQSHLI